MTREQGPDSTLRWSTTYRLSPRQREILSCLANKGGTADLVALTREVAAHRQGLQPELITQETIQQTYTGLHSLVTEDLTKQGLVEYCEREGIVEISDSSTSVSGCRLLHSDGTGWGNRSND